MHTDTKALLHKIANAASEQEAEALIPRYRSPFSQDKSLIPGIATAPNRVAVLIAIAAAVPALDHSDPYVINLHGCNAFPTAIDVDRTVADQRRSGPKADRWNLALVDTDGDKHVIRCKYLPRTVIFACSREPMSTGAHAAVECR